LLPVVPLIGGRTRFQPVFVGDVADAFAAAAEGKATTGEVYELGGPEVATHRELLQRVLHDTFRRNLLVPVPPGLGKLMALPFAILPFPPLVTADQVDQLQADNVVSEAARRDGRTLESLGIQPTAMEAVLPSYLWRFRRRGQFDRRPIRQAR
jgi:NADH dehydrogenase